FKSPGVAETLDWAGALTELDVVALDPATVSDTLGVLLKYQDDITRLDGSKVKALLDEVKSELRAAEERCSKLAKNPVQARANGNPGRSGRAKEIADDRGSLRREHPLLCARAPNCWHSRRAGGGARCARSAERGAGRLPRRFLLDAACRFRQAARAHCSI